MERKFTDNAGDAGVPGCCIDLHLHLDGSLSLRTVRQLAKMQGIRVPEDDRSLLRLLQVDEGCRDLNDYLKKFDFPLTLLQTREAISLAVGNLLGELEAEGVIYAEIRFAPQLHVKKGLTQAEAIEAAAEGLKSRNLPAGLILCCMRGDSNAAENEQTVEQAGRFLNQGVCALDLAGAEALYPTEKFRDIFALAKREQIPFTIHAGEADGADSVWTALGFGAARIGHGVRAVEDEALMQKLARERIPLELCPTSNLNTNVFSSIEEYPLRKLMKAGIPVTVNTDNRTVSGTNVRREFAILTETFDLSGEEVRQLLLNSVDAAFTDGKTKAALRQKIEEVFSKKIC